MRPEEAAERGALARMREDAALTALLGGPTRIVPGWPGDTMEATDFPRVTFYVFGAAPLVQGVQRVRLSADLWVWPTGESGGRGRLLEIDERVSALFEDQHFAYEDHWMMGSVLGFRDFPGAPGNPLRRLRELALDVTTT